MTMSEFFESVGAPLNNVRWSWGAIRPKDGAVFLRAWKDQLRKDAEGREWVMIGGPSGDGSMHGWYEREEHLKAIESGARCLIVLCEAVDVSVNPRTVAVFDHRTVVVGGEIKREQGTTWIRVADYKSVFEVR